MLERSCSFIDLSSGQCREDRRHAGQARHPLVLDKLQYLRGKRERSFEDQPRARAKRHDHLVQSVIEGERQDVQNDLVFAQLEIGGNRRARGQHVPVRQHHALGIAGRSRGIHDGREVDIDAAARRRCLAAGADCHVPAHRMGQPRQLGVVDRSRRRSPAATTGMPRRVP